MSGIDNIPEGWEETTLHEVVSKLGDGLHGTPKYSDDGEYFFINGNNLSEGKIEIKSETKRCNLEEHEKYRKDLNDRTILVSINGSLGYFAYYNNEKCFLGKSACYFNVKENVSKRFVGYQIRTRYFQKYIERLAGGTTIKNVSLKTMREFPFVLPKDVEEQKAIAAILSAFDNKIELLQAQNKTLEETAQTIFKEWFGKYQIEDELPEGWRVGKIGEVVNIKQGKYVESDKISEIKTSQYRFGVYGGGGVRGYLTDYVYETPQVILTCRGNGCGRIQLSENCSTVTNSCMALEDENSKLSYRYMYLLTQSIDFESVTSGSAQPQITVTNLEGLEIIVPKESTLVKFNEIVKPFFQKLSINKLQIQTLTKTRDTLLPKLMSGEIRVNEFRRNETCVAHKPTPTQAP